MEIKSKILVRFCPIKYFSLRKCSCKYEVTKFSQSETNRYYFSRIDFITLIFSKYKSVWWKSLIWGRSILQFFSMEWNQNTPVNHARHVHVTKSRKFDFKIMHLIKKFRFFNFHTTCITYQIYDYIFAIIIIFKRSAISIYKRGTCVGLGRNKKHVLYHNCLAQELLRLILGNDCVIFSVMT